MRFNFWLGFLVIGFAFGMSGCGGKNVKENAKSNVSQPKVASDKAAAQEVVPNQVGVSVPNNDSQTIADIKSAAEIAHSNGVPAPLHWGYSGEGSPEHWGDLDQKFVLCKTGKSQSPIDLIWKRPTEKGQLQFAYHPTRGSIIDNGHSIQVNFETGNRVNIHGQIFDLKQVHFHSPSEHTISGKSYPVEAHFVHKNEKGEIAVVAVLFSSGKLSTAIDQIWSHIPKDKGVEVSLGDLLINPSSLKSNINTYYFYHGSLTTPPCSENVTWVVLNTPMEMSETELKTFRDLYHDNNRPLQKLNERQTVNF